MSDRDDYRTMPGYAWCMTEGAIIETLDGHHYEYGYSGRRCRGEHRKVAVRVTKDEYPKSRAIRRVR